MNNENYKLIKKTELEKVTYVIGKYFTGDITLLHLIIQLNSLEAEINKKTKIRGEKL